MPERGTPLWRCFAIFLGFTTRYPLASPISSAVPLEFHFDVCRYLQGSKRRTRSYDEKAFLWLSEVIGKAQGMRATYSRINNLNSPRTLAAVSTSTVSKKPPFSTDSLPSSHALSNIRRGRMARQAMHITHNRPVCRSDRRSSALYAVWPGHVPIPRPQAIPRH